MDGRNGRVHAHFRLNQLDDIAAFVLSLHLGLLTLAATAASITFVEIATQIVCIIFFTVAAPRLLRRPIYLSRDSISRAHSAAAASCFSL
jgi:hypothetical protein